MEFVQKDRYDIGDLLEIVRILRAPGGCPWDREQTHASIRTNLIEETYEVADAIDQQDVGLLREELGDLLLQVALHTEMEAEEGRFDFSDVCDGISKKLIHRHPHVFGDLRGVDTELVPGSLQGKEAELIPPPAATALHEIRGGAENATELVLKNWEALKNDEKGRRTAADRLDSVPASLPALMRSAKVQKRAADFGFCYADAAAALADLESEVAELRQALEQGRALEVEHEAGDVLFSAVNVARMADVDAEEALTKSCNRFAARVKRAEQLAGDEPLEQADAAKLDVLWKQAKKDTAGK